MAIDSSMSPESPVAEGRCPICLHPPTEPATIHACGHGNFCLPCLRQWAASQTQPRCPLCQAEMAVLCHAGGEETVVPKAPTGQPDHAAPDLMCLDHAYFEAETARLLRRAHTVQHNLSAASYGCGRRGSAAADDASSALSQVIASLRQRHDDMSQLVPFVAEDVLQELYAQEMVVTAVADGTWAMQGGALGSDGIADVCDTTSQVSRRLSAADAAGYESSDEGGWSYDEDDDSDDDNDPIARHAARLGRMTLLGAASGRKASGGMGGAIGGSSHKRQRSRGSRGSLTPVASSSSLASSKK